MLPEPVKECTAGVGVLKMTTSPLSGTAAFLRFLRTVIFLKIIQQEI